MRRFAFAALAFLLCAVAPSRAAEWRVEHIDTPARTTAIATVDGDVRVMAGGLWYRLALAGKAAKLVFIDTPAAGERPDNALPDGGIVTGRRDITRAWLAGPTARYDHGVLGDAIEASAVVIETRDGKRQTVRLKDDAVFEDLKPRLADLDGDGFDEVVVVKSYLKRGSSLAIISERNGKYEIVAETPPLGAPHRWLAPAGIADFTGDGKADVALVRQPHVIGSLELWTWAGGAIRRIADMPDVSNHFIGSRAIDMSAVADFDGDGIADLAVPSLDRKRLRIVTFMPQPHELFSIALPAKAVTDFALVPMTGAPPAIAVGLENGSLALIRRD